MLLVDHLIKLFRISSLLVNNRLHILFYYVIYTTDVATVRDGSVAGMVARPLTHLGKNNNLKVSLNCLLMVQ